MIETNLFIFTLLSACAFALVMFFVALLIDAGTNTTAKRVSDKVSGFVLFVIFVGLMLAMIHTYNASLRLDQISVCNNPLMCNR